MNSRKVLGIIGLVAYIVVGFPYLSAGLVVPGPWLFILWAVWIAGLVWAWRTFQERPVMVLIFAPAAVAFWLLYVTIGERLLGWTP